MQSSRPVQNTKGDSLPAAGARRIHPQVRSVLNGRRRCVASAVGRPWRRASVINWRRRRRCCCCVCRSESSARAVWTLPQHTHAIYGHLLAQKVRAATKSHGVAAAFCITHPKKRPRRRGARSVRLAATVSATDPRRQPNFTERICAPT